MTNKKERVPFSYLDRQFADIGPYLSDIEAFVKTGDFTLGAPLAEFEERFARLHGMAHAVGVGTGTDAISMSLRLLGVGPGDEVITTPMTFVATVGAIVQAGATPTFVDSDDGFVIDATKIEEAITPATKAIVPVHYSGNLADMPRIKEVADDHELQIVEDACQAMGGQIDGRSPATWGAAAAYSLHPLKNLNVWSDGGMITTQSEELRNRARAYRNHGLEDRDTVASWGVNCRFDTIQAVVGNRLIQQMDWITESRIANANQFDKAFRDMDGIYVPVRRRGVRHVFHLYMLRADDREGLLHHLHTEGIEAKVHYPTPMHLQPAARELGYGEGDFPQAEADAKRMITLPCHQHLRPDELDRVIQVVADFAGGP